MAFDDVTHDGKADAKSSVYSSREFRRLAKRFENMREEVRIDTDTAVGNRNVVKAVARDWKQREAEVWAKVFADVVENVIYKRYDFGNDPAPYLNRHGILHGRVPDYADKLNSIRVFLLVDAIAYLWLEKQQQTPLSASP